VHANCAAGPRDQSARIWRCCRSLERDLSGALGASSARVVSRPARCAVQASSSPRWCTLFDEASRKLRFNRELLETMMDNLPQGVCVVNAEMRLVAWNQRYLDLFEYPPGFVFAGKPVRRAHPLQRRAWLVRAGDPDAHSRKRLAYMRAGSAHTSERRRRMDASSNCAASLCPTAGFSHPLF
jgi:PAS domain-containing protein